MGLKIKKPVLSTHFYIVIGVVIAIAFIIFQGFYDWKLNQTENSSLAAQPIISSLIDDAVNNLDKPAPVDAQTGQVYFPDVRFMLPAPSSNYGLRGIIYADTSDNHSFNMQVTSQDILNLAENKLLIAQADAETAHQNSQGVLQAIFRQVPELQSCARGVQLFYASQGKTSSDFKLAFTKQLSSGKTLYAYSEPTCSLQPMPALISYLKEIQSY